MCAAPPRDRLDQRLADHLAHPDGSRTNAARCLDLEQLIADVRAGCDIDATVEDQVASCADASRPVPIGLVAPNVLRRSERPLLARTAFPSSADRGLSSGEDPRGGGRVRQARREGRDASRPSTTFLPLWISSTNSNRSP
jgi:hypothetical protein